MWLSIIAILFGFVLLALGADRFILGSTAIAKNLKVSPLIIGITIVGFATSAPEMLVSSMAAWHGELGLAIGNGLGSNITNIALVLGITALIKPLEVRSIMIKREFPLLAGTMAFVFILISNDYLSRLDGVLMLSLLVALLYWLYRLAKQSNSHDAMSAEIKAELPKITISTQKAIFWLILGLIILLLSSRIMVWGAIDIAHRFGISELIIGLTIVAFGTSLPELAASIVSVLRNEPDIAIGNIVGSHIFNLLAVIGLPGLIHPGVIEKVILRRDFPVMIILTLALWVMSIGFKKPGRINRFEALLLLSAYIGYTSYLYLSA